MPLLIDIDLDELEGITTQLNADRRVMERAAQAAANRTVRWARMQLQRELGVRLGIPKGPLAERMKALLSRAARGNAALWIGLRPLNVVRMHPRPTRRGLSAAGREYEGAFVARGRGNRRAAMRRRGRTPTPLEAVSLNVQGAATPILGLSLWPRMQEHFIRLYQTELEKRVGIR